MGGSRGGARRRTARSPLAEAPRRGASPVLSIVRPASWDAARQLARQLPRSAFRGQPDQRQVPATSLERAAARLRYDARQLHEVEVRMLREVKRRARQYLHHLPDDDDEIGWLALLRHHGAPTRLLDFTKSFYVAAWFAVEAADADAAVWAVDLPRLRRAAERRLRAHGFEELPEDPWSCARELLARRDLGRGVVAVEPFLVDERVAAQQGMFLLALDPAASFVDNLAATFEAAPFDPAGLPVHDYPGADAEASLAAPVVEIVLPQQVHRSARDDLWRMNLTAASFFPGLDGFARSLLYFVGLEQPES